MNPSATPFLRLLAGLGSADLRPDQFRAGAADRLRRDQLRGTIEQMRIMLLGNTFFAPALSFQAWNTGVNMLVVGWTSVIVLFSWWLFFSWKQTYQTSGTAQDMHRFVMETFVNASLWSLGMALFYPVVEGDQKAIVATIMAGSLALGSMGFSRTPSAAFTYLGVQTIGNSSVAFICGWANGSPTDYLLAFLSFAAGISLFNAVLERGKSGIIAFRNHEQLTEKGEVIELLLKDYEEQATEWLWQTDRYGNIISAPIQVLEMLGIRAEDMHNSHLASAISAHGTEESREDIERLRTAFNARAEFHDIRLSVRKRTDGALRWILMKGRPQFESGEFRGFRGIFADATVAVVAERQVQFLAKHDSLTGLYNRNSVQKRLSELRSDQFATVFMVDLDGFKQVNDSYGHHVGDCLLVGVARRLQDIWTSDAWTARLGGDEFFVLVVTSKPLTTAEINWFADDIIDRMSAPFQIEEFDIQVSASVGIASFPEDTDQGLNLLSLADLALYEAKSGGRNRFELFDVEMQKCLNERIAVIERLKVAVRNGDIVPYYQSQHALDDGRLIGFEALARWFDEELGFVGPDVFIPIAEQTGLIVELGEHLLRLACADASRWAGMLNENAPVVSVNFSPVQFARADVTALVSRVLTETGLAPALLEIEVTEGVLIANKDKIAATLRELSALGVSIALDDFGTGYSSLSYLKQLPLNRLKIDRSFVMDLDPASDNSIVSTVIQLGHNLGLSVIAEGVEDEMQVETLCHLGCDDAQGYLFGRPAPVNATNELVARTAWGELRTQTV